MNESHRRRLAALEALQVRASGPSRMSEAERAKWNAKLNERIDRLEAYARGEPDTDDDPVSFGLATRVLLRVFSESAEGHESEGDHQAAEGARTLVEYAEALRLLAAEAGRYSGEDMAWTG